MAQAAVDVRPHLWADQEKPTDQHHLEEQCRFCFDVIMSHFRKTQCSTPQFPSGDFPLFVTWNKYNRSGSADLRGCIGSLSPISIYEGIKKYAAVSAFQDSRFNPVAESEVASLECSVTLLYKFELAQSYLDWTIGVHGMIISFTGQRGEALSATYLPFVCAEQGWTQDECIKSLVKKAGYNGAATTDLLGSIKLTRYQGCKATVSFADYQEYRKRQGQWQWDP